MRISSAILLLALAACSRGEDKVAQAEPANRIDCATGGAKDFTNTCAIERSSDGRVLTLRHGDGGFRRLDLSADRTVTVADGADEAEGHTLPDGRLEVAIGGDRYRLPMDK